MNIIASSIDNLPKKPSKFSISAIEYIYIIIDVNISVGNNIVYK